MSQFFEETAHRKIDLKKYQENWEHIFGKKEEVPDIEKTEKQDETAEQEVAHLRTDVKKYQENYDSIDWGVRRVPDPKPSKLPGYFMFFVFVLLLIFSIFVASISPIGR